MGQIQQVTATETYKQGMKFSQSSHSFSEGLTHTSDVILYLAKVKFVQAWFAVKTSLFYMPLQNKTSGVAAVSCHHLSKDHVHSVAQNVRL